MLGANERVTSDILRAVRRTYKDTNNLDFLKTGDYFTQHVLLPSDSWPLVVRAVKSAYFLNSGLLYSITLTKIIRKLDISSPPKNMMIYWKDNDNLNEIGHALLKEIFINGDEGREMPTLIP